MNINYYLAQDYGPIGCWDMVADVYARERSETVDTFKTVNSSVRSVAAAFRLALHKAPNGFTPVDTPTDYTVVLMGKAASLGWHHVGVWFEGRVLHSLPSGPVYQDMASLRDSYPLMEFWAK